MTTGEPWHNSRVRTILHVDMDAFFVSVELRRHPHLRGQPVVVGGSGARGVVAAANYEARCFGVFSAMPSSKARRLCPQAVFLDGDHAHYSEVSREVMGIFEDFTPLVEPLALDEAFLDVTGSINLFGDGEQIARRIREHVQRDLDLTCAVGVATTKFIAKLASKQAKPRARDGIVEAGSGVVVVEPGTELAFLHPLPVSSLWGVGPVTLAKLAKVGVRTVGDLARLDAATVERVVGKSNGRHLHDLAHGRDERPVVAQREAKSIGREETYARDLHDPDQIRTEIVRLSDDVAARLRASSRVARTATLKVRFSSFETVTRSVTPPTPVSTGHAIVGALDSAMTELQRRGGIRLLGISVSGLVESSQQLSLLDDDEAVDGDRARTAEREWTSASGAIDAIRRKFGRDAITPASVVRLPHRSSPWGPRADPDSDTQPSP